MHVKLRSDTILDYLFSETATWSLSTDCGGVSPLTLVKQGLNETTTAKAIHAYIHTTYIYFIIGLPVSATPNQERLLAMPQKDKMGDETLRRLCVPHSPFIGADFCGEGTGHFQSSSEQTWKLIWNKHKIIALGYWPYIYAE